MKQAVKSGEKCGLQSNAAYNHESAVYSENYNISRKYVSTSGKHVHFLSCCAKLIVKCCPWHML